MQPPDRRFKMKWWGWGTEGYRLPLPRSEATLNYLRSRLGVDEFQSASDLRIASVQIPASRAAPELLNRLAGIVGPDHVRTDHRERLLHSVGKSYKDLIRLRSLRLESATDAVLYPHSEDEVQAILELCQESQVAVVPFGGGTSVVSGLEPETGAQRLVISLDLAFLNQVLQIDQISCTATVQAGIFGPALEAELRRAGFVLGHYPQSFEFSTLGGWIATRSSGQNCLLYGGIERLVESVRVVTPAGTIETLHVPRRADGPDIGQMILGSEGAFGVIVAATVRVRPAPQDQDYFMYAFRGFRPAAEACRTLLHSGVSPALVRISDEQETEATLALGHRESRGWQAVGSRVVKRLLARRGMVPPHLSTVLIGLEGTRQQNRRLGGLVRQHFSKLDAFYLGRAPGRRWLESRFQLPYLRDELLDNGLLIDTLETATTWSRWESLYEDVRAAILTAAEAQGQPLVVYAHLSHLYLDGVAIYFSLLGRQDPADPLAQWGAIKTAAGAAIRQHGAVISHHHGVGMDHREQTGRSPIEHMMLAQLKQTLDPRGIMNPGKLL